MLLVHLTPNNISQNLIKTQEPLEIVHLDSVAELGELLPDIKGKEKAKKLLRMQLKLKKSQRKMII